VQTCSVFAALPTTPNPVGGNNNRLLWFPAGANARLSIIPGVKERFEYEVVEQTGSPFSARRRVKTAFNESPRKAGSPHKGGA
jgi:hypothetical protein